MGSRSHRSVGGDPVRDRQRRRQQVVADEALDVAVAIMSERGVGGLTVAEVARRMGMRGPSLYKYFDSLHAVYDALFARGVDGNGRAVAAAVVGTEPGIDRLRAGAAATVRWCVQNPALAQLLYWRPVPGFAPADVTFAASREQMIDLRAEFGAAVACEDLTAEADSDEAVRLFTVIMSGLIGQQLANQPGVGFDEGAFSSLTDAALDLFFTRYRRH